MVKKPDPTYYKGKPGDYTPEIAMAVIMLTVFAMFAAWSYTEDKPDETDTIQQTSP